MCAFLFHSLRLYSFGRIDFFLNIVPGHGEPCLHCHVRGWHPRKWQRGTISYFCFFGRWQEWQLILFQSRPSQNKLLSIRRFLSHLWHASFSSGLQDDVRGVLAARRPFHCAVTQHIPLVWRIGHCPTVRGCYSVSHSCVGGGGEEKKKKKNTLTCSHSLDVATLIMKGINIPTSAGLIRLSFHTKTDSS